MVAAAIGAGASVIGAASSIMGSGQQQDAASQANSAQLQMYNQMRSDLMPYMNTGAGANANLVNLTGIGTDSSGNPTGNPLTSPLLKPITMDQATLEQTPGYQFNLSQGLKSVQNSAAARGLGTSGAALKGAAAYATGLADSTYQNQFSNALTNQNNQFNRLLGLTQLGQASAAGVGAQGIATGQGIASNDRFAGNAAAAGTLGAGNALAGLGNGYLLNNFGNNGNNGGGLFGGGWSNNYDYNNLGANIGAPSADISWT